jgi:hypothetical protein
MTFNAPVPLLLQVRARQQGHLHSWAELGSSAPLEGVDTAEKVYNPAFAYTTDEDA